ncbi:hypothetical protein [Arthrobacter sp. NPDC089319]|uniref:hypothetical protein n=1 Tax=Arthrobacter sp. NPDC089319 TaxID=3155915 RepID=UPI00344920C1
MSAALFTATSSRPYFSTVAATIAFTSSPWETSTFTKKASPPPDAHALRCACHDGDFVLKNRERHGVSFV